MIENLLPIIMGFDIHTLEFAANYKHGRRWLIIFDISKYKGYQPFKKHVQLILFDLSVQLN